LDALLQQLRSGGAVDGAVHSAPAQERRVGGVDNGIDLLLGDIPFDYRNAFWFHAPT
jgi:hypothetical protein